MPFTIGKCRDFQMSLINEEFQSCFFLVRKKRCTGWNKRAEGNCYEK